uniref:C1q and TNF related 13 n=1 Tax=Paramormyrops kingsleyae TaxID=1676925 RepID=A0A3B3TE45_9TELE
MASWTLASLLGMSSPHLTPEMAGIQSAFSAAPSSSFHGGSQKAVTFDRLLLNIGHDLNPDTGVFRCCISGTYSFSYTVGKFPKKPLSVMLVKNRQEVQPLVYNDHQNKDRKETVWLLHHNSPKCALYSNTGPYVTFIGYLAYPDISSDYLDNHLALPGFFYPSYPFLGSPRKAQADNRLKRREMQSQSLLLSLREGDTVWLYSHQHKHFAVYSNQGPYTTFSGFLVYPEPLQHVPSNYPSHQNRMSCYPACLPLPL